MLKTCFFRTSNTRNLSCSQIHVPASCRDGSSVFYSPGVDWLDVSGNSNQTPKSSMAGNYSKAILHSFISTKPFLRYDEDTVMSVKNLPQRSSNVKKQFQKQAKSKTTKKRKKFTIVGSDVPESKSSRSLSETL